MQDKQDALVFDSTGLKAPTQQGRFLCKRAKYSCTKCTPDTTYLARLVQLTWPKQNCFFYLVWSKMRAQMASEASPLAAILQAVSHWLLKELKVSYML